LKAIETSVDIANSEGSFKVFGVCQVAAYRKLCRCFKDLWSIP